MTDRPATPEELFLLLEKLDIETRTTSHPPFFTVEDGQDFKRNLPGGHTKNLFVKDKKGNHFLVIAEDRARIEMNRIHGRIGARSRLSFANAQALMSYLGVAPGSVTAFAAMNDSGGKVKLVIDAPLLEFDELNCHPLTNTMTTTISRQDLLRFLEHVGHVPEIISLSNREEAAHEAGESS